MNTYRIRTHNPILFAVALTTGLLIPPFFLKFYNNGALLTRELEYLNDVKYTGYGIVTGFFFLLFFICYYFISRVNVVTISQEGVNAQWCQSFPYFKKIEKTIKWVEILNFTVHPGGRWLDGIIIETQNAIEYKFFCISLFLGQRSYRNFLKDFRAHVSVGASQDDMKYL